MHAAKKTNRSRVRGLIAWASWTYAAASFAGCVGMIGEGGGDAGAMSEPGDGATTTTTDPGADGGTIEQGEDAGITEPGGDSGAPSACAESSAFVAPYMRRLTIPEYRRTVAALLGDNTDVTADFPSDPSIEGFAFDNNADGLNLSLAHVESYETAAETLSAHVMATPALRTAVVGCDLTVSATRNACLASFIQSFGRRAYRRPLTADEVSGLTALAHTVASDPDPYAVAALALQGMLQSPNFLFRVEIGADDPAHPGARKLTGYEVATRLSYLLWGTTPDDALLDAAQSGALDTAAGITARARTMLADMRARPAIRAFYQQWLQLDQVAQADIDATQVHAWTPALASAMVEETSRVMDDFIWSDGANLLDALTARYSYVNPALAALYGVTAPASGWARVDFAPSTERGGILTQASYLSLTARSSEPSPIIRGKWVRESLLCQLLPPPPPNVPAFPPPQPGVTIRQRLAQHRADPACAGCHELMDPVGFGMERFDVLGRLHPLDERGMPLSGAGSIAGFDPANFMGALDLEQRLHDAPETASCVVRQTFRYSFGRFDGDSDACAVAQGTEAFRASNGSFRAMVLALVGTDSFRYVGPQATSTGGAM